MRASIFIVLALLMSVPSYAENLYRFLSENKNLVVDGERGFSYEKNSDILWNVHVCSSDSKYDCLIIEGHGIEVVLPKENVDVGDKWIFDGREYEYIANCADGKVLASNIVAQKSDDLERLIVTSLFVVDGLRVKRVYNYYLQEGKIRSRKWYSEDDSGVDMGRLSKNKKFKTVKKEKVDQCSRKESFNCLQR